MCQPLQLLGENRFWLVEIFRGNWKPQCQGNFNHDISGEVRSIKYVTKKDLPLRDKKNITFRTKICPLMT
jgi:hypothetical protein